VNGSINCGNLATVSSSDDMSKVASMGLDRKQIRRLWIEGQAEYIAAKKRVQEALRARGAENLPSSTGETPVAFFEAVRAYEHRVEIEERAAKEALIDLEARLGSQFDAACIKTAKP
jgi:hypothetical protein